MSLRESLCVSLVTLLLSLVCSGYAWSDEPEEPAPRMQGDPNRKEIIQTHFENRGLDLIEGIWITSDNEYEVAILRNDTETFPNYDYLAVITDTRSARWETGMIKFILKATVSEYVYVVTWFDRPSRRPTSGQGSSITLRNENMLEIYLEEGPVIFFRMYPKLKIQLPNEDPEGKGSSASGTGFFISNNHVVTNYHVIKGCSRIFVHVGDLRIPVEVLIRDPANDVAILSVNSDIPASARLVLDAMSPLKFTDAGTVREGDPVYTIGYPLIHKLGVRPKIGEGIVNGLTGYEEDPRLLQVSIPIQPGNSGGPLFDAFGGVIGIVTSSLVTPEGRALGEPIPQNVNFAVKSSYVLNLVRLLPDAIPIPNGPMPENVTASEIMERARESVVLVEARTSGEIRR